MRYIWTAVLLAAICTTGSAAQFQDASSNLKTQINENCDPMLCRWTGGGALNVSGKIRLTPSEEAALVADSVIRVWYLGFEVEAPLGSSPNFKNGDTSAHLQNTIVQPGSEQFNTLFLKWGNGVLEFKGYAKAKLAGSRLHDETFSEGVQKNEVSLLKCSRSPAEAQADEKDHQSNPYIGEVHVDLRTGNSAHVFDAEAVIITEVKDTVKKVLGGVSTSNVTTKVNFKSNTFILE